MGLSDFSENRRTTDGSRATEGLFNRPLSDLSVNLDQLNSDVSAEIDDRYTKSEADSNFAESDHTHAAGDVDVGTFADARIAETNVTQHESALSVSGSQVTSGFLPDSVVSTNVARLNEQETVSSEWTHTAGLHFSDAADSGRTRQAARPIIHHGSGSTNTVGIEGAIHTEDA